MHTHISLATTVLRTEGKRRHCALTIDPPELDGIMSVLCSRVRRQCKLKETGSCVTRTAAPPHDTSDGAEPLRSCVLDRRELGRSLYCSESLLR